MAKVENRDLVLHFISMAQSGEGRALSVGGGNMLHEITILKSDLAAFPNEQDYVGGTARITLNRYGGVVGYKFVKQKKTKSTGAK